MDTGMEGLPRGIKSAEHTKGPEHKGLGVKLNQIEPVTDLSHFERHWEDKELGLEFKVNGHFESARECVRLLEQVAKELVDPEELNRAHTITLEFDVAIGVNGVVELEEGEKGFTTTRDQGKHGEAEVQVVPRIGKPWTRLLTFQVEPIYPPKGSKEEPVKFQVSSAFPGLPTPALITKRRAERYVKNSQKDLNFEKDKKYWQSHAFVVETPLPGMWLKEHDLPLPQYGDVLKTKDSSHGLYHHPWLLIVDDKKNVVACVSYGSYELYSEWASQYDEVEIFGDISDNMKDLFPEQTLETERVMLTDEQVQQLGLNRVDVGALETLTGYPDEQYVVREETDEDW